MDIIKFRVVNDILKCGFINGQTKEARNYNEKISREILAKISRCNIDTMFFSKDNIIFEVEGKKIEIIDGRNIVNDLTCEYYKDFRFIKEYINKKRFKLWVKENKQKTFAIGLSMALAVSGVSYVTASKALAEAPEVDTTSIEATTTYDVPTEETTNQVVYKDSEENEILNNDIKEIEETTKEKEIVKETEVQTEEQTTDIDYISMLEIGTETDSDKFISTKENYYDIIEKYANMYGINPDIICAIATQESGVHSREISPGGGLGLMQVQASVWNGHGLTVHNYETDQDERINFTTDSLRNLENNIQAGCAIYKMCLDKMEGNYVAALQCYNMGEGSMGSILSNYSSISGKSKSEILKSNDFGWLNYTNGHGGDPNYVKNVLRYFDGKINEIGLSTGIHI